MLRTRSLVLLAMCLMYAQPEYTFISDGWIPITSDQVYNPRSRTWPQNAIDFLFHSQSGSKNINKATKIIERKEKELPFIDTTWISSPSLKPQTEINDKIHENDETKDYVTKSQRKSKILNIVYSANNVTGDTNINIQKKSNELEDTDRISLFSEDTNTYEVEENNNEAQDLTEDTVKEVVAAYNNPPPAPMKQNFSSTLFNILSKYNIKTNDRLENYDLSRQLKIQPGSHNLPRVIHPYRHNSLNHLPVDPLLAVFLSNYGFYFPSLYGMKSNYNNLYGYLASNNIHNNRPFGLYKVFSDTDSWN